MDISAVILTYNCTLNPGKDLFEKSLKCLSEFPEIVAIDGGSTDQTVEILKSYGAIVHDRPNIGPNNPIPRQNNYALRSVNNDFVFFLDSDESINPNIYNILKERHMDSWLTWIPRVTMIDETKYITTFVPDPQARFMRVGYAFWQDIEEEQLHQIPYVVNGMENNVSIKVENEYTIRHFGYVLSDDNVKRIREKYRWHNTLKSKATRNIFKLAEEVKMDPVDYMKTLPTEVCNFK